jgi:hypothetical protein
MSQTGMRNENNFMKLKMFVADKLSSKNNRVSLAFSSLNPM